MEVEDAPIPPLSFNKLFQFLQDEFLCDVVIQAGQRSFSCHRIVLACLSDYFKSLFTPPFIESKKEVIKINEIDECTMEQIIKFAYTSRIEINSENIQKLMEASSLLLLNKLGEECCNFVRSQIDPSNCIGIRELSLRLGFLNLFSESDAYLKYNFREVTQTNEFLCVNADVLCDLLKSQDLFVESEEEILFSVLNWVQHDANNRNKALHRLLSEIRLPLIPSKFLRRTLASLPKSCNLKDCKRLLQEALDYNLWVKHDLVIENFTSSQWATPRKSYAGVIFYIGGTGLNALPFSSVQVYSLIDETWNIADYTCSRKRHFGCTSQKGRIYILGGYEVNRYLKLVAEYHPVSNEWRRLRSLSVPRKRISACTSNEYLYAIGGLDDSYSYSIVERMRVTSGIWETVHQMNTCQGDVAVAELNGLIYAFGGNSSSTSLNSCEVYDPNINKWTSIPNMNQPRHGAAAVAVDAYIYVIGGYHEDAALNSVEKYDPVKQEWCFVSPMHVKRAEVGAVKLGRSIHVIGGRNITNHLDDIEIYDVQNDSWSKQPRVKDYRVGAGVTTCFFREKSLKTLLKHYREPDE